MSQPRVAFFLEDTEISRTNRLALAHADALIAGGHIVRIITKGLPVTWRSSRAEWIYVDDFREYNAAADERVIREPGEVIVDEELYRDRFPRENEPMRVLLCGASQSETKGIDDGYGAIAHARWFHQKLDLIRVSPYAPSREEPLDSVQEFHVALTTREMTRLMHSCDIVIVPGWSEEGFELPLAEALASGLPVVATNTEGHRFDDAVVLAPERNAVELGERLIEVLGSDELRGKLRVRGREVAERWRS